MRVRDVVADCLGAVLGRQRFARLARFLWLRSQLDVRNDLQENGERDVQEAVLRRIKEKGFGRIFDVGANVGQWTKSLLDLADHVGLPDGGLELHLFEPAPESADVLQSRLEKLPSNVRAEVNRVAVAAQHGRRQLHMAGPTGGTNSLFRSSTELVQSAEVSCITLDEYCREHGIGHVDFTKVDAEGADYRVLEGGFECLREGVFSLMQFEYNHRWIYSRHYLRDAFALAEAVGNQIGKVTPRGVEIYEE